MQLGSASTNAAPAAVDALLAELRAAAPGVRTLQSSQYPGVFGQDGRIIFYVGGFRSRESVIAECGRIGRAYPDQCLARLLG